MSFDIKNNWYVNLSAFVIAIGITMGTGSLYRFLYNYNLIMAFTLFIMALAIFYQSFVPISTNISTGATAVNKNISIPGVILITFMLFIPLFSDIINNVPSLEIVYFYIAMFSLSFLLESKFREKIFNAYLIIIVALSVISMLMILLSIFTEFLTYFPQIRSTSHFATDFYFISSINPGLGWIRNQSIFWEPGAFGFHLIFATLLAYKRYNKLMISILVLACISTFSTTVFIFLVLLGTYHVILGKNKFKYFIVISGLIALLIAVIVIFKDQLLIPKLITQSLIGKFSPKSSNYVSFTSRSLFSMEAFKMFLDNFFIGAGHYATAVKLEVVKSGATVNSSGLAGLLAEFGLFGAFCIFLYTRYFWKFGLFAIPITLIWLNGEFLQYSPLAIFILADSADSFANKMFPQKVRFVNKTD